MKVKGKKARGPVLLERDVELAEIETLIARSCSGSGSLLVVEGPAGAGKTSLLDAAVQAGRSRGMLVLEATGTELERELGFGVVRSLFENAVVRAEPKRRTALLSGAARPATPVITPTPSDAHAADPAAVLHGLFWLASNLAAQDPLMLVIDDAHWADGPSLRFLMYLARRLDDLPLMAIIGLRPHEPGTNEDILSLLSAGSDSEVLVPAPLSDAAVERLITQRFAQRPAHRFVEACHAATGGNPFLVGELLTALESDRVPPTPEGATRVGQIGPQTVSRAVLARVSRIGAEARALTEAVAVLGGGELRQGADLAGITRDAAAHALDELAQAGVLRPTRPLQFVHPLVRAAVYESIPPGRRSTMHAVTAKLLAGESADRDRVAVHLLNAEPAGEAWIVDVLREAAEAASARGAPEQAAEYLRRALREPPQPDQRSRVLHQLGAAELFARDPAATEHLAMALDATDVLEARADVALLLGRASVSGGRLADARTVIDALIDQLGEARPGVVARLEAYRSAGGVWDPRFGAELERERPRLRALAERTGSAGRSLLLMLAFRMAFEGGPREEIVRLVERGLDRGRLMEDESAEAVEITWAARALTFVDELELAERLLDEMASDSRKRGSVAGYATASAWRADVALRRGRVGAAEADARTAIELASAHGLYFIVPHAHSFLGEALTELGELEDAGTILERADLGPMQGSRPEVRFLRTRARVRLARGDRDGAIADLRACQAQQTWFLNPNVLSWRSLLALALPEGAHEEALELVDLELKQARDVGQPRAIGVALRARGLLSKGQEGITILRQAVATLEDCPSTLEQGRAVTDLGAALRRAGARSEAREVLSRGLDLAATCGARALAAQAREELVTAGARPRRERATGIAALTESERRVAQMAARGMTNREIAQALFVTVKTVALHLTRSYQKLEITGRTQLPGALGAEK